MRPSAIPWIPLFASGSSVVSAPGFAQTATVNVLGPAGTDGRPGVRSTTGRPSRVSSTTRSPPAGARKTTKTEALGPSGTGTRVVPAPVS